MAVLSKNEADNVFESWSLASDDKEMHGGAFLLKLVKGIKNRITVSAQIERRRCIKIWDFFATHNGNF